MPGVGFLLRETGIFGIVGLLRNTSGKLGKWNSKITNTFREIPLGKFQWFFFKSSRNTGRTITEEAKIDMLVNRRSSERRLCRRLARIQFGTGSLPRDCTITDVSAGGVKVIAEYLDIPSEFTIILSEGRPRQCRLAWRIGFEFGAQFID